MKLDEIQFGSKGTIELGQEDPQGVLERYLTSIINSVRENEKIGDDITAVKALLGTMNEQVRAMDTRLVQTGDGQYKGMRMKDMFTPEQIKRENWQAVMKMPTTVERVYDKRNQPVWLTNENPVAMLQDAADQLIMYGLITGLTESVRLDAVKDIFEHSPTLRTTEFYRRQYLPRLERVEGLLKGEAFDIATAGQGLEFIPTTMTARFWEKVRLELRVANLFQEVIMPRSPYVIPVWLEDLTAFLLAGPSPGPVTTLGSGIADDATTFAYTSGIVGTITSNKTLQAKSVGAMFPITKDLEVDSLPDVLAQGQRALVLCLARAWDDTIVNGDTAASHQDTDVTGADRRRAFDGLRKTALANAAYKAAAATFIWDGSTNNWSQIGLVLMKLLSSAYNYDASQVGLIVSGKVNLQIRQLPDFRTLAALAGLRPSTVITGGVGTAYGGSFNPDGLNYVVSEFMREDLNASGVFDNVTTTKTAIIAVNVNAWARGVVQSVSVQVLREVRALQDQDVALAKMRIDFKAPIPNSASGPLRVHTAILYNVTP